MDAAGEVKDDAADTSSFSSFKLYETQFFGFTPQTLMLRVYSAFQDCLCDILPVLETVCVRELRKGKSGGEAAILQSKARDCSRKLQVFLEERFKKMWEHMEVLLSDKCFSVPTNVLLPEDKSHSSYPQDIKVSSVALNELKVCYSQWIQSFFVVVFCETRHVYKCIYMN